MQFGPGEKITVSDPITRDPGAPSSSSQAVFVSGFKSIAKLRVGPPHIGLMELPARLALGCKEIAR
jgi:hypothetical protein